MTWFEALTAGAAWIALCLSVWMVYLNRKVSHAQLARWENEQSENAKAKLEMRILEGTRVVASALVIENVGLVDAFEVGLALVLLPNEDNFCFIGHSPEDFFPATKLSPSEQVSLKYTTGMDGPEFLKVSLTWKDGQGNASILERRLEI